MRRRRSGFGAPNAQDHTLCVRASPVFSVKSAIRLHCTVRLTVAVLLAKTGSGVVAIVAAFSVITVPAGAVTLTVRRTVDVVLGAMLAFS
jgi:hypothetical protein